MADKQNLIWESSGGIIPEGWNLVSLSSLLENPKSMSVGVMYPGKHFDDGIPLIRVSDVKNGGVASKPDFCISADVDEEYKRTRLSGEELLITLVGNPGDCVIATQEMSGWNAARAIAVLRLEDPALRQWVRIVLLSGPSKHIIDSRLNTTVQKTLNLKDIRELPIPMPPASLRESLCSISKKFEEKCLINHQTNQTLESMAQALFKSWFVDFDPVFDNLLASADFKLENLETSLPDELKQKAQRRLAALNSLHNAAECKASLIALAHELQAQLPTKEATQSAEKGTETPVKANFNTNPNILAQHANTHAHFPNEFEHSEQLGWIPKGWKQKYLSDLLEVKYGKDHKKLDDGKYPVYGSGGLMRYAESFLYDGESVLIPRKGTLSNIMHINGSFWTVDTMFYTIPKVPKVAKFMFYHLKALDFAAMNVGSAVPSMTTKVLNSLELLFPSVEVLYKFDRVIEDYFNKIDFNKLNINQLESLRNTLLPKLISGELQIPDVATDEEIVD
ncbi:restriction endonuclease subunit S [Pseudoalteromonas sp. S558]|uniref:restriction endonuclease subunit S n=1 Tax=Pseudoalteromonas sp. S558 TaxID=2066515 RepID=UPI00110B132B|nr:restriction endonuclease subunit S [Pseudoalteromonas sp. S558]TMN99311.1 hypothetical protein CWB66_15805 [Pseudoalteromonas sp. S558]